LSRVETKGEEMLCSRWSARRRNWRKMEL